MMGLVSPPRANGNGTRLPLPSALATDGRNGLTRRFTTDSGRVPTLNSLAVQRAPATAVSAAESQDFGPSVSFWLPTTVHRDAAIEWCGVFVLSQRRSLDEIHADSVFCRRTTRSNL